MQNQHLHPSVGIFVAVCALASTGFYVMSLMEGKAQKDEQQALEQQESVTEESTIEIKTQVFTGTLEKVNTGCFADSECYVVVDRKHVTALKGWEWRTVGRIEGVEGFGDLEAHVGKTVEVYAQELEDGTFTLYGDSEFYIKLVE